MSEFEKLQLSFLALIAHGIGHHINVTNVLAMKALGGQNEEALANLQKQAPILRNWHTELARLSRLAWASDTSAFDPRGQAE